MQRENSFADILRCMNRGRPKLPEGQARSETIHFRIKQSARERLTREREKLGISESEAIRRALAYWISRGCP